MRMTEEDYYINECVDEILHCVVDHGEHCCNNECPNHEYDNDRAFMTQWLKQRIIGLIEELRKAGKQ